jgi:hypothetical protein
MKKKFFIIIGVLLIVFIVLSAAWFGWRSIKYSQYTNNMERVDWLPWATRTFVPRYFYEAEDGFQYSVKYPTIFTFTGNLGIASPGDFLTDSIIIWPVFGGGYQFGVQVFDDDYGYRFYIDSQGNAIDSNHDEIAERHNDTINNLLNKARAKWKSID